MSSPTSRERAASRAEARRRARLAARGETADPGDAVDEHERDDAPERESFVRRLFPPAPPLPDKPDPMATFDREGGWRPVRERLFLLRQNPIAWLAFGGLSFLGLYASFFYRGNVVGLIATFVQFAALIAAGWFGWQRPTLYGTAAGTIGGAMTAALVIVDFVRLGISPEDVGGPGTMILQSVVTIGWQAAFGFIGGWYGGYLRRRQTQVNRDLHSRRR